MGTNRYLKMFLTYSHMQQLTQQVVHGAKGLISPNSHQLHSSFLEECELPSQQHGPSQIVPVEADGPTHPEGRDLVRPESLELGITG